MVFFAPQVRVKHQTAKHKKSPKHIEDHLRKAEKRKQAADSMETESVTDSSGVKSSKPKVKDRSRTDYKRRILHMTSKNGPRAVM